MSKWALSAAQQVSRNHWREQAPEHLGELLDAYSSWLFFERHFLHIGRFGVKSAAELIDTVMTDNIGAAIHMPPDRDLPDYSAPARRAALVLSAAGLDVERLVRLVAKGHQNMGKVIRGADATMQSSFDASGHRRMPGASTFPGLSRP
jgi:hypothetical protein